MTLFSFLLLEIQVNMADDKNQLLLFLIDVWWMIGLLADTNVFITCFAVGLVDFCLYVERDVQSNLPLWRNVHQESNHPPLITKQIPQSVEARLSNISLWQSIRKH